MKRDHQAFKPRVKEVEAPEVLKRRQLLHHLVRSPAWGAVKEVAQAIFEQYASPLPVTPSILCGYFTFAILRDGIGQLLAAVEAEAALAQFEDIEE